MCMFFILNVFYQRKEIATYRNNDLKYRYIQMQGEITPAGVIILDSIFENRRDSVRVIRKQVEQYEKSVTQKVKQLEQARLKELEAKRMREEVKKLKQGK